MKEFLARWGTLLHRIALMPVAFLGVGLYRAWLATFFRFGAFPHMGFADYAVFEISIGVVCLIAAALTPKIAPLWSNRRVLAATGALSVAGSAVCVVESCLFASTVLKYAGLVLAGAGLALLILVWCEFFGALNPMRVAIYHAAGIFFGELFCWLFMGLDAAYIMAFSIGLPVFSLAWARRSMERLPEVERPHAQEAGRRGELPWKPILLMATCTFATRLRLAARPAVHHRQRGRRALVDGVRVLRLAVELALVQLRHHLPARLPAHDRLPAARHTAALPRAARHGSCASTRATPCSRCSS